MKLKIFWIVSGLLLCFALGEASADYSQELQDQVRKLQSDYPQPSPVYFRDAGIIINKADDAGLYDLAAGWVKTLLFEKMAVYVKNQIEEINRLYASGEALKAGRQMQDLLRFERYYLPSEEFLRTAPAQALVTDMVQLRENAMEDFEDGCMDAGVEQGLIAIRQTGLFMMNNPQETESLRKLNQEAGCCLGWRRTLHFKRQDEFKNDYEAGKTVQEGTLRLESSAADMSQARWAGEFLYKFTGREGQGLGTSRAVLVYHRGSEDANMKITPARMTSTGRMNFPHAVSGEDRTLEVIGNPMIPGFKFFEYDTPFTGCRDIPLEDE